MNESDARERIRQMISFVQEEAKEKAREIESKTEHEYNLAKAKHLHNAKEKLTAEYEKKWKQLEVKKRISKSTAINAARMEIMTTRNNCMNQLLEDTKHSILRNIASNPNQYKDFLKRLLVQSFIKMLEAEITLQCRREDLALVEQILPESISTYLDMINSQTSGHYSLNVTIDKNNFLPPAPVADSHAASCCGGVILTSQGGLIRCINTVDERLELAFNNTVPLLRRIVFGN
ncbi:unnamed protein product [Blepharisma stoltei]|uniref:Vacuolar ATP synthase subunit E n=1 Tax=Blepharisma stoltei TaxID=1481888 RepID=A0AAU9JB77_9CILI|nr:unnamed protein product [Blepharisma stoltei]